MLTIVRWSWQGEPWVLVPEIAKKKKKRKVKRSHYTSSCGGMGKSKIDSQWFPWKEKPAQNRERQSGFLEMWTHRCYIKSVVFEILKLLWASYPQSTRTVLLYLYFHVLCTLSQSSFVSYFFISDFLFQFVSMTLQCHNTENNVGFSPSNVLQYSLCKNLSTEVFDLGNGFLQGWAY